MGMPWRMASCTEFDPQWVRKKEVAGCESTASDRKNDGDGTGRQRNLARGRDGGSGGELTILRHPRHKQPATVAERAQACDLGDDLGGEDAPGEDEADLELVERG